MTTRPILRLAVSNNHPANAPVGRWQGHDPVFFHKSQIRIGTKLQYFGRIDHGEVWEVTEIKTYRFAKTGRVITRKVEVVEKLSDDIVLMRGNNWRQVSFAYLSYAAVWRIAP